MHRPLIILTGIEDINTIYVEYADCSRNNLPATDERQLAANKFNFLFSCLSSSPSYSRWLLPLLPFFFNTNSSKAEKRRFFAFFFFYTLMCILFVSSIIFIFVLTRRRKECVMCVCVMCMSSYVHPELKDSV